MLNPQRKRAKLAHLAMERGVFKGTPVWLPAEPLEDLTRTLTAEMGFSNATLSFLVGTGGAYQKATVQVVDDAGRVRAFAKIADHDRAMASLSHERDILVHLAETRALRDHVPGVLGWLRWHGARVLLLTAGPDQPGPPELGSAHLDFLARLHASTGAVLEFREGPMWARLQSGVGDVGQKSAASRRSVWEATLEHLDRTLGRRPLVHSLAHRDFTMWNTRIGPSGLFVLDWEAAQEETVPLYDGFHFLVSRHAYLKGRLGGKSARLLSPGRNSIIRALADRLGINDDNEVRALYRAYLLDMSLFYASARILAPESGSDDFLNWLIGQQKAATRQD